MNVVVVVFVFVEVVIVVACIVRSGRDVDWKGCCCLFWYLRTFFFKF